MSALPQTDVTMPSRRSAQSAASELPLDLLRCPQTGRELTWTPEGLQAPDGPLYPLSAEGTPMFAMQFLDEAASRQRAHYDAIAAAYEANLSYPHTREYLAYLDEALFAAMGTSSLGTMAELCCGLGEAVGLFSGRYQRAVGLDISPAMLRRAAIQNADKRISFVQGDATRLPFANGVYDTIAMLGGIHHISNRPRLFSEVARVLKPGGRFIFREPVSDFLLWRCLRAIVYRVSPILDHTTERPLLYAETVPPLREAGFHVGHWSTHGFIGFCLFMNSDVLFFNRLFRFIPGIAEVTRAATRLDRWCLRLPGLSRAGLQVVGIATKPVADGR